MHDNLWLERELQKIWQKNFPDVEKKNEVIIRFGRRARTRLGSIRQIQDTKDKKIISSKFLKSKKPNLKPTIITINGLFRDENIPEFIITATIAHELIHYAHGFSSPHDKAHDYPHYGGVVRKEMIDRGFEDEYVLQKKWLKQHWKNYIEKNLPSSPKRRRRKGRYKIIFRYS